MKRLSWWGGVAVASALVVVVLLMVTGFPRRSGFLADREPGACELVASRGTPFGSVTSCIDLGRRTPWFGRVDGEVFVLLETDTGTAGVRIDYRDSAGDWRATAVEVPVRRTPGISPDAAKRQQQGIDNRGGLHPGSWTVRG